LYIGKVTPEAAEKTGLPAGTPVLSGCTDGTAGCLASGAKATGDLNVTLGTTLVFKAIADEPLIDPTGAMYNHRHPAGGFLPGAASSTGCEWINKYFADADLDALGKEAAELLPTHQIVYPLIKKGERFPFACPSAVGFGMEELTRQSERFAAGSEAVAYLERMGIECIERLGLGINDTIYATGGGVSGETWLRIRAAVNRRCYAIPEQPECVVGAAVLAAMGHFGDCRQAIEAMIHIARRVEPEPSLCEAYEEDFAQFKKELGERGYL
jgi:xylulokinase